MVCNYIHLFYVSNHESEWLKLSRWFYGVINLNAYIQFAAPHPLGISFEETQTSFYLLLWFRETYVRHAAVFNTSSMYCLNIYTQHTFPDGENDAGDKIIIACWNMNITVA